MVIYERAAAVHAHKLLPPRTPTDGSAHIERQRTFQPPPPLSSAQLSPAQLSSLPPHAPPLRSPQLTHPPRPRGRIQTLPAPLPHHRARAHSRTPPHPLELPYNALVHLPILRPHLGPAPHPHRRHNHQRHLLERRPRREHRAVGRDAHLPEQLEVCLVAAEGVSSCIHTHLSDEGKREQDK